MTITRTCANCNARIVQIETGRWADLDRIDVDCTGLDCHGDYHDPLATVTPVRIFTCLVCGAKVAPQPDGPVPGPNATVTCIRSGAAHLIVDPDLVLAEIEGER